MATATADKSASRQTEQSAQAVALLGALGAAIDEAATKAIKQGQPYVLDGINLRVSSEASGFSEAGAPSAVRGEAIIPRAVAEAAYELTQRSDEYAGLEYVLEEALNPHPATITVRGRAHAGFLGTPRVVEHTIRVSNDFGGALGRAIHQAAFAKINPDFDGRNWPRGKQNAR